MREKSPYRYIHDLKSMFVPRTPTAALHAAEEEILPIEAFIYKSTGLNPIMKKPYNLDEIEWVLSRPDRDLETNLLLNEVLTEISQFTDKEVALFAAESLNALEREYNTRLMELKETMKKPKKGENSWKAASEAANIYYQMALLHKSEQTLRNFYMKEAYLLLGKLENEEQAAIGDRFLLIRILLHLKLYDQAEELIPDHPDSRLLRMEIAYEKRDSGSMLQIVEEMNKDEILTDREKEILQFWTSGHE